MKKLVLAAAIAMTATGAFAGNMKKPVMEPAPVVTETKKTSSSSSIVVPLILLAIVVAAVASNN